MPQRHEKAAYLRRLLEEELSVSGARLDQQRYMRELLADLWNELTKDDDPVFRSPLGRWRTP